jgi:hypothetical protein
MKRPAVSQKVKNTLLEDNKYLEKKYLRYKNIAKQKGIIEIKTKYEFQKKI